VIVAPHEGHLRPVAWLYLWQKPGWRAWEVMQVFVFEKLRGQGLAKKLYQAAINHDGLVMASGKSQSASSRSLWKSFVKQNMFEMFAINYKNLKERSQVFWDRDEEEIWCEMPIYFRNTENEKRDVRLIATRKQ
jgi:GNAT superfamily N-acetyltransferase